MHDARIGRFLSIDPLAAKYLWDSLYAFSKNRVIDAVELEGLEKWLTNGEGATAYGPYSHEGAEEAGLLPASNLYNMEEVTILGKGYGESSIDIGGALPNYKPSPRGPKVVWKNQQPGTKPDGEPIIIVPYFLKVVGAFGYLMLKSTSTGTGSSLSGDELVQRGGRASSRNL